MPATATTTERGHAGVARYGHGHSIYLPNSVDEVLELTWPSAVQVYDRVRRSDSKASSSIRAMFMPILAGDWRVRPRQAKPEVVQRIAEDLGLPILDDDAPEPVRTRDRFDWGFFLRHAMLSRVYGFMPFNLVYRLDDDELYRIRKLAPRMPHTLTARGIRVAEDGGLEGIEQQPARGFAGGGPIFIPVDELVMFVHEREGANWHGQSLLRPIYRDYLLKDHYHRIAAISIDRHGAGTPIYTDADPDKVDDPAAEAAAGQKLAESYRSGESSGGRIPHGATFELHGVKGSLPNILEYIRYHDEQIAGATLEMFSSLPSAPNGSRALGDTLVNFFTMALNAHSDDVATIVTNHVVEDYVDANWGPDEPAPAVECAPIGADQQLTAAAIKQLIDAKAITPDPALQRYLRRFYKLPEIELDDPDELDPETLERLVAAAAALVRAGWTPEAALESVGLDPMEHTGLLPVTVQAPPDEEGDAGGITPDTTAGAPRLGRYQQVLEQLLEEATTT